jgi:hypothetical protein
VDQRSCAAREDLCSRGEVADEDIGLEVAVDVADIGDRVAELFVREGADPGAQHASACAGIEQGPPGLVDTRRPSDTVRGSADRVVADTIEIDIPDVRDRGSKPLAVLDREVLAAE